MANVSQKVSQQESHLLYNGTVHLDFDPIKHVYKINGVYASGVTTALSVVAKPQLVYWAANEAANYVKSKLRPGKALDELEINDLIAEARKAHLKKRDTAADAGTLIHDWIEAFVKGENPDMLINENLTRVINDFKKFWEEKKPKVLHVEKMLCSPTRMLAGRVDLICEIDGKLTILDWKTGSGIYPNMFPQMGAYALMFEEEYPDMKVEQLCIVNASVKNMFQYQTITEVDLMKDTYIKVLDLYKANKEVEAVCTNTH